MIVAGEYWQARGQKFDGKAWRASDPPPDCARWRMWEDLTMNHLTVGMPRAETEALLGAPDSIEPISRLPADFSVDGLSRETACSQYDLSSCRPGSSGDYGLLCWDDEDRLPKTAVWSVP
jgi:hypothetical protein